MAQPIVPNAPQPVLSTLNRDGTRRWMRPKLYRGRYYRPRWVMAWGLMILFFLLPHLKIGGKPALLLNIGEGRFFFFGAEFLSTDSVLLLLLLIGFVVGILIITALAGRVWCGWACPQTVYMEFFFRPIDRLLDRKSDRSSENANRRKILKFFLFLLFSLFLAHTFLAYFVGIETLFLWVRLSPAQHPTAFLMMAGTTAAILFDFGWFREQTCLVVCPYGRFQSAFLDKHSLVVGYDETRGEPRVRRGKRNTVESYGDCIDCGACVATCPTGIDIREGVQMECIACTQCIDACDFIMDRIDQPRGLIRYSTQAILAGESKRFWRPRVVLYPVVFLLVVSLFVVLLEWRETADVTLLRGIGVPYTLLPNGEVSNQIRVRIANRTDEDRQYALSISKASGVRMVAPENPLRVAARSLETTSVFANLPVDKFQDGRKAILIHVEDGDRYRDDIPYNLLGPQR